MEAFQTILDERRRVPFHHSLLRGLALCWPLAVLPHLILAAWTGSLGTGLLTAFVVNNLLTVLFYREDKYRALYKYWRIPEINLHIWALLCGWPGAWYARHAFRHKKSKSSFVTEFWICVILNITALFLFFHYGEPAKAGKALGTWWREVWATGEASPPHPPQSGVNGK